MEENDLVAKGYHVDDIAWLESKDKPLGMSASLGMWLDTLEAAEWIINNGMVCGQRYIGSIEAYQVKKKRCHRCQVFGHLAWSCKEALRCRHCGGGHDRRDCPPWTGALLRRLQRGTSDGRQAMQGTHRNQHATVMTTRGSS